MVQATQLKNESKFKKLKQLQEAAQELMKTPEGLSHTLTEALTTIIERIPTEHVFQADNNLEKPEHYIVFFHSEGSGFGGWNACYATSLDDCKKQMKAELNNEKLFKKIDWSQTLVGKAADVAEPGLLSMLW